MAIFARNSINIKDTSESVTVKSHWHPQLKYYLSCVNNVLIDENIPYSYRNYGDYKAGQYLDLQNCRQLKIFLVQYSPDEMKNTGLFHEVSDSDDLNDGGNMFIEIHKKSDLAALFPNRSDLDKFSFLLGQRIQKISVMIFKLNWVKENYYQSLISLTSEIQRLEESGNSICNVI
jgi:hypothetical protein